MHESLTLERVMDAAERGELSLDSPGFCLECGEEQEGCEPDMRGGRCACCGAYEVYGAMEILIRIGG